MRNIEEIAAEEEARLGAIRKTWFKRLFLVAGWGLGLWGWFLFYKGNMGKGAVMVLVSILFLLAAWEGILLLRRSYYALFAAGAVGLGAAVLYAYTHLPSFYWGHDPAYWLAVHAGAVTEPFWSPLAVLMGQAACFLFPKRQFMILPELPGYFLSVSLFLALSVFFDQMRNKSLTTLLLGALAGSVLAVSAPVWEAATRAGGLTAGMGLLLFLLQKSLLAREVKPWGALSLLQGLLWCVHPAWGLMGAIVHLAALDGEGRKWIRNSYCFLIGLTPFLWVLFRAGKTFPSWGGDRPFPELLREGKDLWAAHFSDGSVVFGLGAFGWGLALLMSTVFFLGVLSVLKWKAGGRPLFSALDFWVWGTAGVFGISFYSPSSGTLGPTSVWFALGVLDLFLRLLDRGMEKRKGGPFLGPRAAAGLGLVLIAALCSVWLPGQGFFRGQYYFPQQHALNLLMAVSGQAGTRPSSGAEKALLLCDDPFEAAACREARSMEPLGLSALILETRHLGKRWYVTQCIEREPELLFSTLEGPASGLVRSLALNNLDRWEIHWARSALPEDWKEPPAFSTVLTRKFRGKGSVNVNGEGAQYRYDLTALPKGPKGSDPLAFRYLSRYTSGFNEMGEDLLAASQYSSAIKAFQRSVKLDPAFSEPQSHLARIYSEKKILEAAQLDFEKIIKTHPGRIRAAMGDLEKAQKDKEEGKIVASLDEMIRLNSQLADAQFQLSVIYDRQGKFRESKTLLESSVNSNPKLIEAQLTLGRLMARAGNRLKAEEAFRAVLGVNPENKEAQVELWKLLNK